MEHEAEIDFICAIIGQAVEDATFDLERLHKKDVFRTMGAWQRNANAWLMSESNGYMSLEWYCNLIGIDPEWVREMVVKRLGR